MHEERRDDLAAYSLGALDEPAARELESHLRECGACASHLTWLRGAADVLPGAVEQIAPPRRLRRELMATVRAEVKVERARRRAEAGGARTWRGLVFRPAAAVTACVLLIAGVVGGYALRGDEGGDPSAPPVGKTAPDATLVREGNRATLQVEGLPTLRDDSVYQVWVKRDLKMNPDAAFSVKPDGTGEVAIKGSLSRADAVLVTREPRGGSEEPTSDPLIDEPVE